MAANPRKASVLQILFLSYLSITIPAILFAYSTVSAIDAELELHIEHDKTGAFNTGPISAKHLVQIGDFLRSHHAPFTNDHPSLKPKRETGLYVLTDNLRSRRAAIIYLWAALLVGGAVAYLLVGYRLHQSFIRLFQAVQRLSKRTVNEKINIEGPADVQDLSKSLEHLRLQLNQKERQQRQFLRHISHEIKTPLTSIKEGSKLLDEKILGDINADQKEITSILVKSCRELQHAIENLLDYNSAVATSNIRKRDNTELSELVKQALEKHDIVVKQKELDIRCHLQASVASVDQQQILTVFDNLISNAIKHSPIGGQIDVWLQPKKGEKVGFIIKDSGPGIDTEQENEIFKPFFVGKQAINTTLKGTGLGLSIAKQYVADHQGELKLLNTQSGAAFQVTLSSANSAAESVAN